MTSFSEKTIRTTVYMRQGSFNGGSNTVSFEGLPIEVNVSKPGGEDMGKATVTVNNMKLDTMQQLTMLAFRKLQTFNNVIKIEAGELGRKLNTVFEGEISSAVPVIGNDGSVSFKIEARTGYYPNQLPTPPTSAKGETTIEKLMKIFAGEAGYGFENKGITASVKNSTFIGSPIQKAHELARQTGIDLLIDDRKFIIQPYEIKNSGNVVLVKGDSGQYGYPSFTNDGVQCKTYFNPNLSLGGFFELQTILPAASGIWKISKLEHKLSANKPTGADWMTSLNGVWVQGV